MKKHECPICRKNIPQKNEIFFSEYVAIIDLINSDLKDEDIVLLKNFLFKLNNKENCHCLQNIENLKKEMYLKEQRIEEETNLLKNKDEQILKIDKGLSIINSKLDLENLNNFIKQEQKILYKNNNSFVFIYMDELIDDFKNNNNNEKSIFNSIKKTEIFVLIDTNFSNNTPYFVDMVFNLLKYRKIYEKPTYVIFNQENKARNMDFETDMKKYDSEKAKWIFKYTDHIFDLKNTKNTFSLCKIEKKENN
jgi:hypothetical protein